MDNVTGAGRTYGLHYKLKSNNNNNNNNNNDTNSSNNNNNNNKYGNYLFGFWDATSAHDHKK